MRRGIEYRFKKGSRSGVAFVIEVARLRKRGTNGIADYALRRALVLAIWARAPVTSILYFAKS